MTRTAGHGLISVMIVDDDPIVRSALTTIIDGAEGMAVVSTCADGAEAVTATRAARSNDIDVILMDVRMPNLDGLSAAKMILARPFAPRIVMLTTYDEDENLLAALSIGASGFLMKDTTAVSLINAVWLAHRGDQVLSGRSARRLADRYLPQEPPFVDNPLGPREFEVLEALCRACSNAQIAATLHLSESTVKSYVSSIMTKLGTGSRLQTVVRAFELGMVSPPTRSAPMGTR
jgi:DNA-binding NarL/FixJ family response regulator